MARGPKKVAKKSAGEQQALLSNDIVNIFKNQKDNEIKPITEYPLWLAELALPDHSLEEFCAAWETDDPLFKPEEKDAVRMLKMKRKRKIKYQNYIKALKTRHLLKAVPPLFIKDIYKRQKQEDDGTTKRKKKGDPNAQKSPTDTAMDQLDLDIRI